MHNFMPVIKTRVRKAVRRPKTGNSPSPSSMARPDKFAACGHSHCGETCKVRYIGPVSPIRDHHIWHVARGVSHIWSAVIIAGLAVVLTGTVAYSTVNAANQTKEDQRSLNSTSLILNKLDALEYRLSALERDVQQSALKNTLPDNSEPVSLEALFPTNNQ